MWSLVNRARRGKPPFSRLRCSFCGRDAHEVARLVAGAAAYICDTCITECVAILQEHGGFEGPAAPSRH